MSGTVQSAGMDEYDLVVVGAGVFGLPVAKTYLEVHPSDRLLVLDAGQSIGGTWSSERMYDELRTNNLVGMLEFSDFPMDFETFGVPTGSHVPGLAFHKYLTAYAQHFGFFNKIKLGAKVQSAELKEDGSWLLSYEVSTGEEKATELKLVAKKLVLAIGTSSTPSMPRIVGSEKFGGHILHAKDISSQKVIDEMSTAKNVVVLGGSKSAADSVYINAIRGRHVDWVIRASGKGPAWLSAPYVSPAKLQFEKLATTRIMSFLSPCFESDGYSWIRKLLHDTAIGRALLRGFFGIIDSDLTAGGKFNDHPETKKLLPRASVYWAGTSVGIFNYPTDLFELIRKGLVHVHLEDIDSLSSNTVHLSNGKDIEADMLICATGWKHTPTMTFLPSNISDKIGVSTAPPTDMNVKAADEEIMRLYPELRDQPAAGKNGEKEREQASWVLYRGTVPPSFLKSRNLAYCGMSIGIRACLIGEITALWITALFDGKLAAPLPKEEEAEQEAMLRSRFYRWRAPNGLGPKGPDMIFEFMPFIDTLMRDIGLNPRRKGGWRELFEWYGVGDYKGVVQEYMTKDKKNV